METISNNVLSIETREPVQKIEIADPVFFKKDQIREGVCLINYGRRNPQGTKWIVKRVLHFYQEEPNSRNRWQGRLRHRKVSCPETLMDAVVLHCENGAKMELTFQYLSYSAIWRLA